MLGIKWHFRSRSSCLWGSQDWYQPKTERPVSHLRGRGPPRIPCQASVSDHNAAAVSGKPRELNSFGFSFEVNSSLQWIKSWLAATLAKSTFWAVLAVACYALGAQQDTWWHLRIARVGLQRSSREVGFAYPLPFPERCLIFFVHFDNTFKLFLSACEHVLKGLSVLPQ